MGGVRFSYLVILPVLELFMNVLSCCKALIRFMNLHVQLVWIRTDRCPSERKKDLLNFNAREEVLGKEKRES